MRRACRPWRLLLGDADKAVACAAACALGDIGTPEAAKALGECAKKRPKTVKPAVADASLVCAERLLADGKKAEATMVYKSLSGEDQPKQIRLAATRGLLSVAAEEGLEDLGRTATARHGVLSIGGRCSPWVLGG